MSVRLANLAGRAVLLTGSGVTDVEQASGGRLPADPMGVMRRWDELRDWAAGTSLSADAPLDEAALGPCVPRPAKVFAIGLNYKDHAAEAGLDTPKQPMVFTKFPSCLVGARADVVLSSNRVDWEVELVVVVGRTCRNLTVANALDAVAGYTVGQDISDRRVQFRDTPAQFCMGKSYDTYGPIGPAVVSLDALPDPNDLALRCDVGDERMQESRTSNLIFSVPELLVDLSAICTLEPGDLIFTGTPSGVGSVRDPRRYLTAGEVITSTIEHLGTLVNRCVAD
jgi:2,4-diketo-3-deoxy-L-fuconate hydrolase